jgi:hypothetical protein
MSFIVYLEDAIYQSLKSTIILFLWVIIYFIAAYLLVTSFAFSSLTIGLSIFLMIIVFIIYVPILFFTTYLPIKQMINSYINDKRDVFSDASIVKTLYAGTLANIDGGLFYYFAADPRVAYANKLKY